MTNKQTLPDIIEIDGVKYVKVVEEPQKPKTLYQMFYDDNRWSISVSNEFCDTVERWMSQYICDYVACKELLEFIRRNTMKCKVLCYVAGKTFDVIVEARDYTEAKIVAKAQHPNAKVVGVTGVFD